MRIDKVLEEKGFGSRKTVKRLFQRKLVKVDERIITDGSFNIDTELQEVIVAGKRIEGATHRYVMMNKPNGVVTAKKDKERQTVMALLKPADQSPDLYPVGRLDRDTEGLLLLTDNGQLGYQLLLPDKKVPKTYEAIIKEKVGEADVEAFAKGIIFIGGETCEPAKLTILSDHHVRLTISEGKFHQVKKMFLATGKKVTYLKRITMGPIRLDETLKPGDYRALTKEETQLLKPYFR